jgi:hypothetical protein
MTYRQMRLLFAGLARYDGRLSVLTARNDVPVGLWTVVLRAVHVTTSPASGVWALRWYCP